MKKRRKKVRPGHPGPDRGHPVSGSSWTPLLFLCAAAVLVRFAASAWVSEDAFITFRVIDNFVNGLGLRWNVDERVQVFTHPLWLLLNSIPYYFTREVAYTTTVVGLLCSTTAWLIAARPFSRRPWILLLILTAPLLASRSLALYGTSGFESPLAYLLLSLFVWVIGRDPAGGKSRVDVVVLLAGLIVVNRMDHLLLVAPGLAWALLSRWREIRWARIAAALSPVAAWFLFAMIYYGFPYPNTALSKLSTEITRGHYLTEGLHYVEDLIVHDPTAAAILMLGLAVGSMALARFLVRREDASAGTAAALACGVLLYCGYVVWIGGGYMSGRFWAAPAFLAILSAARGIDRAKILLMQSPIAATAAVASVPALVLGAYAAVGAAAEGSPRTLIVPQSDAEMRLDRRGRWSLSAKAKTFSATGRALRSMAAEPERWSRSWPATTIGFAGYEAGPDVILIDRWAIGDPLLARLPLDAAYPWKIGHMSRVLPAGYLEARGGGTAGSMDPDLRAYYERLRLITAGPLLSAARLGAIVAFNTGAYESHRERWWRQVEAENRLGVHRATWAAVEQRMRQSIAAHRARAGG